MDCFASRDDAQCEKFFSAEENSLDQRWSPKEVLWLNPPWTLWPEAAANLLASQCTAICVVPGWDASWVQSLVHAASRRLYVETGTRMFQRDGKKSGATQWGTWVLRIDGDVRPNTSELRAYNVGLLPRWRVPETPGTGGVGPEGPDPTPGVKGRKAPKGTQTGQQPRLLDLFSGTGSVGNVFADEGYEVVTVDVNPRFHPTVVADIMEWDYRAAYPVGYFDVFSACPPCEQLSQARTTAPRDLVGAERLVQRALEIVRYFRPSRWFMENPRTGFC